MCGHILKGGRLLMKVMEQFIMTNTGGSNSTTGKLRFPAGLYSAKNPTVSCRLVRGSVNRADMMFRIIYLTC